MGFWIEFWRKRQITVQGRWVFDDVVAIVGDRDEWETTPLNDGFAIGYGQRVIDREIFQRWSGRVESQQPALLIGLYRAFVGKRR